MKARVKATGEIVEVREVTKYDSDYYPFIYCKVENEFPYRDKQLDFEDLTEGKVDVKEKSLPKDEPDYWEKLKHQYAGMAMQGILSNKEMFDTIAEGVWPPNRPAYIAARCDEYATALVNRLKEEEK